MLHEITDLSEPLNAFVVEILMNTLVFEDPSSDVASSSLLVLWIGSNFGKTFSSENTLKFTEDADVTADVLTCETDKSEVQTNCEISKCKTRYRSGMQHKCQGC